MNAVVALVLTNLLVLGSCQVGRNENSFSVRAEHGHLVLRNGLAEPVRYWALEEEISALTEEHPVAEWPSLAPGKVKLVGYGDLEGYTPSAKQARVYWWTESGGFEDYIMVDL